MTVKHKLEQLGHKVTEKTRTALIIETKENRVDFLKKIALSVNGRYEEKSAKSSAGRVAVGDTFIYAKLPKGTRSPTMYEQEVVTAINNKINAIGTPIDIIAGNKTFKNIIGAIQVDTNIKRLGGARNDPKTDIILYSDIKNLLDPNNIFISHKKAGGPEAFQQYGGVTELAGLNIYNHPEVQDFMESVIAYVQNGKLLFPVMKPVKDIKLINWSIFGPESHTNKYSLQHCTLIGQGQATLNEQSDGKFKLDFQHMSLSNDLRHFKGEYEPVFGATYRSGRGFTYKGVSYSGVRLGIYPKKLMQGRGGLITLK